MIVLDTTILVYAVGGSHGLAAPCRDVVRAVSEGELRATTTAGVIQEFAHVRARRRDRDDAADLAGHFATLLAPLLQVQEPDVEHGLDLFRRHGRLGAFDAVLAAATIRSGAAALISADRAFRDVPPLTALDPGDQDFADALQEVARRPS